MLASLSARPTNALYDVHDEIQEAISRLLRLHNRIERKKEHRVNEMKDIPSVQSLLQDDTSFSLDEKDRGRTVKAFLTFPHGFWHRRLKYSSDRQRESLFNAYTIGALSVRSAFRRSTFSVSRSGDASLRRSLCGIRRSFATSCL